MNTIEKKSLNHPDETRKFPKGQLELVMLDGISVAKATFQPGWKWTESLRDIAKTDTCQASHNNYVISGRMHVKMDDGIEKEYGPGDVAVIPPGHDAWVIGKEPCVVLDFNGMTHYAEQH
jgi:uncharacterized RmlC-like cupin family protein